MRRLDSNSGWHCSELVSLDIAFLQPQASHKNSPTCYLQETEIKLELQTSECHRRASEVTPHLPNPAAVWACAVEKVEPGGGGGA